MRYRSALLPWGPNFKAGNMNHKLIVVFDSFNSEDHVRFFATWLRNEVGYVSKVYVVQDESEDPCLSAE